MAGSSDLFKFPRTRHLFDAGGKGVSRDDLLLDQSDEKIFYSSRGRGEQHLVAVEEKVDGANLGISIGTDMRVSFQNRSHFINSKTHRQFNSLDSWLAQHSSGLYEALEPGRHVLFGEWLYAKHSIHYTKLPGYFLAFDIYDRTESRFLSRRERNRQLEGSGIPVVRLITEQAISGREEVRVLLDTPSAYYDGPCEGVYLRIDTDSPMKGRDSTAPPVPHLLYRSKLVRPDFLQQIDEQWTRQQFTKNIVLYQCD